MGGIDNMSKRPITLKYSMADLDAKMSEHKIDNLEFVRNHNTGEFEVTMRWHHDGQTHGAGGRSRFLKVAIENAFKGAFHQSQGRISEDE
jgi:hypothetical protein